MTDVQSDSSRREAPMRDDEAIAALNDHAVNAAQRACAALGGKLHSGNLDAFLSNRACLRLPTELRFDGLELDPHQFANPAFVTENGERRCILHVRPLYKDRPDTHATIVAYMAAAINYGAAASAELCETFGAILLGIDAEEFYTEICRIADA